MRTGRRSWAHPGNFSAFPLNRRQQSRDLSLPVSEGKRGRAGLGGSAPAYGVGTTGPLNEHLMFYAKENSHE